MYWKVPDELRLYIPQRENRLPVRKVPMMIIDTGLWGVSIALTHTIASDVFHALIAEWNCFEPQSGNVRINEFTYCLSGV